MWNPGTKSVTEIDMSTKKDFASFICWSKTEPVLAIGTEKGSLVFFNKQNQRKIPCVGKHSKKVNTGGWNSEGTLISGAEDKVLTVSNGTGDTVCESFMVKGPPVLLQWAKPKKDEIEENKSAVEKEVSAIINKKTLILLNIETTHNVEISFSSQYGKIVDYQWFGDGYVAASFTNGYISIISTHKDEIGNEIYNMCPFNSPIEAMIINESLGKLAVAAHGTVKLINMNDWTETKTEEINLSGDVGRITSLEWTSDGQILTCTTSNGGLYGFLMVIPGLCCAHGSHIAMLSTLSKVEIKDCMKNNVTVNNINLEIEPAFIGLGKSHCAVGINNKVWYYRWREGEQITSDTSSTMVCQREYFTTIKDVVLNDKWTAVLSEGKCTLHVIEAERNGNNSDDRKFPMYDSDQPITNIYLTEEFLIMSDTAGKLKYYLIDENQVISEYSPENPIEKIFPNKSGTKCICIDNTGCGYLYNPVDDSIALIPNFSASVTQALWDITNPNMFVTYDKGKMNTYLYMQTSLDGPTILHISRFDRIEDVDKTNQGVETKIHRDLLPITLKKGYVYTHSPAEGIRGEFMATHSYMSSWRGSSDTEDGHLNYFLQNMAIQNFAECFNVAAVVEDELAQQMYDSLGKYALKNVELLHAENAYRLSKNVGMVYAINSIKDETEKYILMGHIASILHKHDIAQGFFLKSSRPELALEMRCDLQDWYTALKLVQNIDPVREPYICRKLAVQIENQGNSVEALKLFERALLNDPHTEHEDKFDIKEHNTICYAGIARTSIKNGDTHRGLSIANELGNSETSDSVNSMLIEIGNTFETVKQYNEAAQIYEKSGLVEKAATMYIQTGQFKNADKLIPRINSPAILTNIAKAKEAEGHYKEAEQVYEKANNYEAIIRLNLDVLDNFQKARLTFKQKSQTPHCAKMIAEYCSKRGAKKDSIEFLILAGQREEAFGIAESNDDMDEYAKVILHIDERNIEEHTKIAQYYENKSNWGKAAKHYEKCENYNKALKYFIEEGEKCIPEMIEMVGRVKIDSLTHELVDYLMGEKDGIPKEPQHTFKLYRAIGNTKQAIKIAITIANQEQELGNYKYAHEILFETYKDIRQNKLHIPYDLNQKLMILHSYIVGRRLIKNKDHKGGAYMLKRVAKNISQFPTHMINILTSTVAECMKAGLKKEAQNWALVLMRKENREQIPDAFKKKISNIALKNLKDHDDENEELSQCPFCKENIPVTQLDCTNCKNSIPFCIASGQHMTLKDWCVCPITGMPALLQQYKNILTPDDMTCPINDEIVNPALLKPAADAQAELKILTASPKEENEQEEEEEEEEDDDM